ncbi:MAG: SPOR domain-containing protein [Pelagimonas sp.]|jgi:hypothetical protein|nr:SPOR domain-containing protein [Pelagimonas sp.]
MSDYTYGHAPQASVQGHPRQQHTAQPRAQTGRLVNIAGAVTSLALILGVGVWGYDVLSRDVSGVPVVRAMSGPMRITPDNPGGTLSDHQGLAVNAVAGIGTAAPPADRLVLAPRPAGLGEEDVAQGRLIPINPDAQAPRPVAVQPAPDLSAPPLNETEDDGLAALVDQLVSGATPLGDLAPSDSAPVITELAALGATVPAAPATAPARLDAGNGLARSLRPHLRPASLAASAPRALAPAEAAAVIAVSKPSTREIAADTLPAGTRLVQIGAYDSAETARTEWQRLETRFGDYLDGKDRVIQKASSGGRVFYRLRAHGFADLSDARRFCAAFVAQNVDCIPVLNR